MVIYTTPSGIQLAIEMNTANPFAAISTDGQNFEKFRHPVHPQPSGAVPLQRTGRPKYSFYTKKEKGQSFGPYLNEEPLKETGTCLPRGAKLVE